MKILIATKFYYRRGGDCIYALNLERLLASQGHEVAVFAMQYPENEKSRWQSYWPETVDFGGGAGAKISAVKRTLGMGDVRKKFTRLLDDFRPDVVHLNNIHSYLSPVVATLSRRRGIPVVWTLHDYKPVCPAYSCRRLGKTCELCVAGSKLPVLKTRCMKGSLAASAVAYLEALRWNTRRLTRDTDCFISPSHFLNEMMQKGGFRSEKLVTLCNFIAPEMVEAYRAVEPHGAGSDYYCYIGRLSEEKGVATLLEAASTLPMKLKVTGDGPLAEELKQRYSGHPDIEFTGRISPEAVKELLAGARLSVMPSECYENNPLGVIESLCCGTPVVGAATGGIPELVTAERGMTFESGNADSLRETILRAWDHPFDRLAIQRRAIKEFSPEAYYERLMKIYSTLTNQRKPKANNG